MSNYNPLVSIVIPVFNGSNYLKDAINSALSQTYSNVEIIVVNDGSDDGGATERIAKSYGAKIRYFAKENGGVATALNLGIEKMTGEYFSWLSHDDMYYPDKIEKQIEFLEKLEDRKSVLYSNYAVLRGSKTTPIVLNHEMLIRKPKYSLLRGCINGITVLVPKSIFEEMGEFNPKFRCTQDYNYWLKIQTKYDFVHMEDVLSITRLHPKQDSNVSPHVVKEGDELWISMIKSMPNIEKIKYENTLYNFYFEMIKFLETTPYTETLDYCRTMLNNLEKEYDNKPITFKVSVVIPFYNRPAETINALKSALKQSYKNLEIILINDGSTEDISSVENYVKKYASIRLINTKKNAGPASARNIGIKASTGDYVAFLDSDDEFLDDKIEHQLKMMMKHNLTSSYTSYIKRTGKTDSITRSLELTGIVIPLIISDCTIATPTAMVNRNFIIDKGIHFNENLRVSEDTCFWLDVAKYSEILLIDEALTIVNVDTNSTAYNEEKKLIGIKNILIYLLNDDYYSNYYSDISLVCNNFHRLNQEILFRRNHGSLNNSIVEKAKINQFIAKTLPYRVVRRFYKDGPKGVAKAVKRRISR